MNKKVLIIGANGFVGTHLAHELKNNNYTCIGADLTICSNRYEFDNVCELNILDEDSIKSVLKETMPDFVINLAAISSVKKSWDAPALTIDVNVKGTINILESIRKIGLKTRVLLIGSSEQYGKIDYSKAVKENDDLNSINPYGISKGAQEKIALLYKEVYGMDVVLVRAFNHIGPGQGKGFVVPDFSSQIVEIERGYREAILLVGNLSAERDFTDVRDIVRAYRLLLEKGINGEVYNVGSGEGESINKILNKLIELSRAEVEVKVDSNKFRVVDTPIIICDNTKLKDATAWEKEFKLEDSLKDILNYWRTK